MSRRMVCVSLLLAVFGIGGLAGSAFWSLKQAPAFYSAELAKPVNPVVRKQQAKEFVQATLQLVDEIRNENQWSERFTDGQLNSWLEQELPVKYPGWIPPGVKEPRLKLSSEAIEVAFQYSSSRFNGVVSGRFKPWVLGPNRVAIQVEAIRIGLMPVSVDQVLEFIGTDLDRAAERAGCTLEWQERDGFDVLVIERIRIEERQPVLEVVQLEQGAIAISGSRHTGSAEPAAAEVARKRLPAAL